MDDLEALHERLNILENSLKKITERNLRVEADKAWETSFLRIGFVTFITYVCTAFVFWLIGVELYMRNALIPTLGYLLSTQSLSLLRSWWISHRNS